MRNKEYYLKEGPLTHAGGKVSWLASGVTGEGEERIKSAKRLPTVS